MIRPFLSQDVGLKRVSVTPSYRFGIGESATFVSGGAAAASAGGGGGGGTANTGGPTNQGASGGGATVGGYQPPTGGNSMSDSDLLIVQDYESNLKIIDQIVQRIDRRPFQVLIEAVIISVDLERARSSESTSRSSTIWDGARHDRQRCLAQQQCRLQSHSVAHHGR